MIFLSKKIYFSFLKIFLSLFLSFLGPLYQVWTSCEINFICRFALRTQTYNIHKIFETNSSFFSGDFLYICKEVTTSLIYFYFVNLSHKLVPCLLLGIRIHFTCGERKICSTIKRSENDCSFSFISSVLVVTLKNLSLQFLYRDGSIPWHELLSIIITP